MLRYQYHYDIVMLVVWYWWVGTAAMFGHFWRCHLSCLRLSTFFINIVYCIHKIWSPSSWLVNFPIVYAPLRVGVIEMFWRMFRDNVIVVIKYLSSNACHHWSYDIQDNHYWLCNIITYWLSYSILASCMSPQHDVMTAQWCHTSL